MDLCVTGHRPARLGGYGNSVKIKLHHLAKTALVGLKPSRVLTGMALGWDQAVAEAAHDLRIPYTAYVPFPGQDSRWPEVARQRYQVLLAYADEVVHVSREYAPQALLLRNEAMVRDCDAVLALYDHGGAGGTAHCVSFAQRLRKPVHHLWDSWLSISAKA